MSNLKKYCKDFFAKNLNEDTEMMLLSNEITAFIDSGEKDEAFTVFYTFAEKFKLFGAGYENIQILLDLLKEYENLSGQLLQKQRDHYSHSVFVFTLGLAIYQMDKSFRETYNSFYHLTETDGYLNFLYAWGLTALFHDIGYPFQLTFDQLKEYCVSFFPGDKEIPYVMYGNMPVLTEIPEKFSNSIYYLLKVKISNFDELFAKWINIRLGYNEKELFCNLKSRIVNPSYSIDHGYFSSLLLINKMMDTDNFKFTELVCDILTAILLHNSLNRYDIKNSEPISMLKHPLAYLLILCDELQSWNRKGFGKDSKLDVLPENIDIEIHGSNYFMTYKFESIFEEMQDSINMINELKNTGDGTKFDSTIMGLIKDGATLNSSFIFEDKKTKKSLISDSRFFNLLQIAKSVHASYLEDCSNLTEDSINEEFAKLSLDFKLSNIHQAKSYAGKLEKIGCFYSDESFNNKLIKSFCDIDYFGENCAEFLARDEHVRWVKDRIEAGWHYGLSYLSITDKEERLKVRNTLKEHKDIIPYDVLSLEAKQKDINVIDNMIPLLRTNGDIKVYQVSLKQKPLWYISFDYNECVSSIPNIEELILRYLREMSINYDLIVGCDVSTELGLLVMKCSNNLNIPYEAIIIGKYTEFISDTEIFNLLASAHYFKEVYDFKEDIANYLKEKSNKVIHQVDYIEVKSNHMKK